MNRRNNNKRNFQGNNQRGNSNDRGRSGGLMSLMDLDMDNNSRQRNNSGMSSLMDIRTGIPRVDNYGSSMGSGMGKTPEQIAFDNEFKKWENSFEEWKMNNRNHPNPEQYRFYENKFIEVREKLMEKRRQIYKPSSVAPQFENQLSAADAMAASILSKFGDAGSSSRPNQSGSSSRMGDYRNDDGYGSRDRDNSFGRGNGNNYGRGGDNNYGRGYNDNSYGRGYDNNPRGGNNAGYGCGYGRDPAEEVLAQLARLGQDPNSQFIISALSSVLGGNSGPQQNYGPPMNYGPRGNFGPQRNFGPRNDRRDFRGNNSNPRDRGNISKQKDFKNAKKPMKKGGKAGDNDKKTNIDQKEEADKNYYQKLDSIMEAAEAAECPKLLSGAGAKRVGQIKKKEESKWNENEKKLIKLYEFVQQKRSAFFAKRDKEKEAKGEDQEMKDAEATEEKKSEVVEDQVMAEETA